MICFDTSQEYGEQFVICKLAKRKFYLCVNILDWLKAYTLKKDGSLHVVTVLFFKSVTVVKE